MQQHFEKYYYLTVLDYCSTSCPICNLANTLNEDVRSLEGLQRALARATSSRCTSIVFPPNFLDYPLRREALALAQQLGLKIVLQVHFGCFEEHHRQELDSLILAGGEVEFLFDRYDEDCAKLIEWFQSKTSALRFTIVPHTGVDVLAQLQQLPAPVASNLSFCFPLQSTGSVAPFNCDQVYSLLQAVRREMPHIQIFAQQGPEIWDLELPPGEHELIQQPTFQSETEKSAIEISVIVSALSSPIYLRTVLWHLLRQDFSRDHFELLIVDASGSTESLTQIRTLLAADVRGANLKYIPVSPRSTAGPVRNLGAKLATGKILVFLDADMLTPNQFLNDVIKQHRSWDIVQYQRFNLKKSASDAHRRYKEVDLATDSYASRGSYWEKFYNENRWKSLPIYWRYLRACCLSIKAQHFQLAGGFTKTIVDSGFDEMFFGYRLSRLDARWKLRKLPIYRLFPLSSRSSMKKRRASARNFFHNTLDFQFYSAFFPFLGQAYWFRLFAFYAARLRALQIISAPFYLLLNWAGGSGLNLTRNPWRKIAQLQQQPQPIPVRLPENEVQHGP